MQPGRALDAKLATWPDPIFVVIDGAHFDDVARMLRHADLPARSLFLEHRNPAVVAAGPFLAPLARSKLAALLAVQGIEAACVFWTGDVAEPVLFRHLRSLNMAEIPSPDGAPEMVLFRHWAPAVLAMLLPVLPPAQRARLFGPMRRLAFYDRLTGAALQAEPRADWPAPPRGFLRLSGAQMAQVGEAMAARSRLAIAAFLRGAAPQHTAGLDEACLLHAITQSEVSGRALGLRTERGLGRWAYLMLVSQGTIAESKPATAFMAAGPQSADDRIDALLLAMAEHASKRTAPA